MGEHLGYHTGEKPERPKLSESENKESVTLHELDGKIDLQTWPNDIEAFCKLNGVVQHELPALVLKKVEATIEEMDTISHQGNFSPNIFFICELYHALLTSENLDQPLIELRDELSSYQNFRQTLLSEIEFNNKRRVGRERLFQSWIDHINMVTRKRQVVGWGTKHRGRGKGDWKSKAYFDQIDLESEWVLSREADDYDKTSTSYASREYIDYRERHPNERKSTYFHATSSASLSQIAKHGALLSRDLLEERGGYAYSGERLDFSPRIFVFEGRSGHQYQQTSWFNEYPVHFGLKAEARNLIEDNPPEHGTSLGKEVPIQYIDTMMVPYANLEEAKKWVSDNSLDIEVQILESWS